MSTKVMKNSKRCAVFTFLPFVLFNLVDRSQTKLLSLMILERGINSKQISLLLWLAFEKQALKVRYQSYGSLVYYMGR